MSTISLTTEVDYRVFSYGSSAYEESVALRDQLLRAPLGLKFTPQELQAEKDRYHLAAYLGGRMIACIHWEPLTLREAQLRQFAVAEDCQRLGVGRGLMDFTEKEALRNDIQTLCLHARENVIGFYIKLGYEPEGDTFSEIGIPHRFMRKRLV